MSSSAGSKVKPPSSGSVIDVARLHTSLLGAIGWKARLKSSAIEPDCKPFAETLISTESPCCSITFVTRDWSEPL